MILSAGMLRSQRKTKTFETEAHKKKKKKKDSKEERKQDSLAKSDSLLETGEGPGGANTQSNKQTLTHLHCSESLCVLRRML